MTGMIMRGLAWRLTYGLIGAGLASALALLGWSVAADKEPLALAGVAIGIIALACGRTVADHRWLKTGRRALGQERSELTQAQMTLHAKQAVFDNRVERTIHEMDEREHRLDERARRLREDVEAERATMRAEILAYREEAMADVDEQADVHKQHGFEVGWEMRGRGIGRESARKGARVVYLPLPAPPATSMGSGALNN